MMRDKLSLILLASVTSAFACGPGDGFHLDPDCPQERPYQCGDQSCAVDAESCVEEEEEETEDYPEEIDGELTAISPGTVLGQAPEAVKVDLQVADGEIINRLIEDGALFEISLRDSTGEEFISADEVIESGDQGLFEVVFTPSVEERSGIRKRVGLRITLPESEEKYHFGTTFLRVRRDISDLHFDERSASRLEGLTDPQQVWTKDLDGDGIDDLIVLDYDTAATRLVVFRCEEEGCFNQGEVALLTEDEIGGPYFTQIVAPDTISTPDLDLGSEDERFIIAYPSLISSTNGELREVEHLSIRLVEEGGQFTVEDERSHIALPLHDDTTWLEDTLQPRLIEDPDSNGYLPGISLINLRESSGELFWNHVILQEEAEPFSQPLHVAFDGLQHADRSAALAGQVSTCFADPDLRQGADEVPEGRLVSVFEVDEMAMVVVASTASSDQMVQVLPLPAGLSVNLSDEGSTVCKLADLDGDGTLDLAFSVDTPQGRALLVSLAGVGSDQVDMSPPQLLMNGLSDDQWEFSRDDSDLRLALTHSTDQLAIAHDVGLELSVDHDADATITITVVNDRPVASGTLIHSWAEESTHSLTGGKKGYDYIKVKSSRSGEDSDGINSLDVGGLFLGSEQLIGGGGMWVAAHFSGGLTEGDETSLLQPGDPKSIIGWLSSTGPFIPVTTVCCRGKATPLVITALPKASDDEDDEPGETDVEAHILSLVVNEDGDATGVTIEDLAIIDGEPRINDQRELELDFSDTELTSQKVVKFKAGADLSKSAASPAHLLLVMDSGELAIAEISDIGMNTLKLHNLGLRVDEPSTTEIFFESLGDAPLLSVDNPLAEDEDLSASNPLYDPEDLGLAQGDEPPPLLRGEARHFFGDFMGLGHSQILEARLSSDDESTALCGKTNHLSMGGGDSQGDLDSIEAALDRETQRVCIPDDEDISIIDLDGDGCQDLVFPESRRALLSRCDGTFEAEMMELGDWSAQLRGDSNSSRSNQPTSRLDLDDEETDDEVILVLPFIDGLQRIQ